MAHQTSRLQRLLTLLELLYLDKGLAGSTSTTRRTAARQIGEIAKLHPTELRPLLRRVRQFLRSKSWDTRVAAAQAIGAIAENVGHPTVKDIFAKAEAELAAVGHKVNLASSIDFRALGASHSSTTLTFSRFDIQRVLEYGASLLASGGQEYDVSVDNSKSAAERLARQKKNLRRKLGLDGCEQFMDVSDMIRDEDLLSHRGSSTNGEGHSHVHHGQVGPKQEVQDLVANMMPLARSLSARERNMLKRKAKVIVKDGNNKEWQEEEDVEEPVAKRSKGTKAVITEQPQSGDKLVMEAVLDDDSPEPDGDGRWPFAYFVDLLLHDMFDSVWEIRHGSIMALREILSTQAASAAVTAPIVEAEAVPPVLDEVSLNVTSSCKGRGFDLDLNAGVSEEVDFRNVKDEAGHDTGNGQHERGQNGCQNALDIKPNWIPAQGPSMDREIGVNVVKPELDLNQLDLNMEIKDEPLKDEPVIIKDEVGGVTYTQKVENRTDTSTESKCSDLSALLSGVPKDSKASKLVVAAKEAYSANLEFLQDCTIRLLCVFSLDRFGDYVSDQVVAPVRETCAQVLGAALKHMPKDLVHETLSILLQMQSRQEWEVRHGSLLGIKYLVAVRQDMLGELLPRVLPACMVGLEDADDDVRAVAAEALTPAAAAIVSTAGDAVTVILLTLWDILLDLDDLSPSTSSVMHLLAELYSQPGVVPRTSVEKPQLLDLNEMFSADENCGDTRDGSSDDPFLLATLVPRLWPFMRHKITSVRHAAIRTLERLLETGSQGNLGSGQNGTSWTVPILGDALRLVFQNLLLETEDSILSCSQRVWRLLLQSPQESLASAANAYFASWLRLSSTALGSPLEPSKMFSPNSLSRRSRVKFVEKLRGVKGGNLGTGEPSWQHTRETSMRSKSVDIITNHSSKVFVGAEGEKSVVQMRVATAVALGIMAANLPDSLLETVVNALLDLLNSTSGVQRQVASMVLVSWFKEYRSLPATDRVAKAVAAARPLRARLLELLAASDPALPTPGSSVPYTELMPLYSKMRGEAGALLRHAEASGYSKSLFSKGIPSLDGLTADAAIEIAARTMASDSRAAGGTPVDDKTVSASDMFESTRQRLLATAGYLTSINLHISVLASLAGAVVWMGELTSKLNPIIQPLMQAVKREQEEILQRPAAEALAEVINQCVGRKPSPNDKLIKNLSALTSADPVETPTATAANASPFNEDVDVGSSGKSSTAVKVKPQVSSMSEEKARIEGAIARRGAELALKALCDKFSVNLFEQLPKLWDCLTESLGQGIEVSEGTSFKWTEVVLPELKSDAQALINNLQLLRSVAPVLNKELHVKILGLLPAVFSCVCHDHALVRQSAAKCITAMAKAFTDPVMGAVLTKAVPMLGNATSVESRQGAGVLVSSLVQGLGPELVAYAPHLIVPLLGCMSDANSNVRQSVTHSFAALVPLLPLARGVPVPAGLSECQASKSADDTRFLEQLLDNTQVDDYKVAVPIAATLRRYQQEGINWLAFLKRFKLHGILCDDMGLGKTLQASAIVASDTAERKAAFATTKSPDMCPLPSLIVCPSTLVGHWAFEIEKFISPDVLNPLQYSGTPQQRTSLMAQFPKHNIIVTSYDVLRKDIDFLGQNVWNYCVLDEGHAIKNSKSKITLAAKRIQAEHRLILSGTPIQNNVLELWSLFDFLMPGFLGSERQFQANYGKPLTAARDPKCSPKEAEAGVLAMEALHKQVMPFLLRRTKDEVLADLPPKIIQDRYCDLSPLQLRLYEDFSRSQAKKEVSTMVESYGGPEAADTGSTSGGAPAHVFQALQYLRRLCSHPLLVVDEMSPESVAAFQAESGSTSGKDATAGLHDLQNAPKLLALKEILEECGIGAQGSSGEGGVEGGQHRVLIFAQLKSFLDIIEKDLFEAHMKSVTYLRLDGSVEPEKRFGIVKAFNSDPTIDVLLLTTHVGGLGLNLTAADTVVFMEHDWNPMRDLQAMDRAHRLGQRRVVNVHRLIMRGTLEEKVMSLQRFKLSVANTIINAENASLNSMDTTQLLDLFTVSNNSGKVGGSKKNGDEDAEDAAVANAAGGGKGMKAMLSSLEELWDQSQYTEEYNMGQFVSRLKS
ncbi:hypothetical protein R1sor_024376 [Riccia sorocarpa]|uniref:TATA-binding protein-associated factor BTAF1 n=1 Tax=Riccia sorocarpa TaxID=122646 RepID=A0ABD3GQC4_9MARC